MDLEDSMSPVANRDRDRRGARTGSRFDNPDRDKSRERERQECRRIYVSNIPYEYRWQDLKDLFRREVGDVSFVELFNDENNKPRGCGIVEFEKADFVQVALDKMNRFELNGRHLVIKEDFGNERDKCGRVVPKSGSGGGNSGGGGGSFRGGRDRDDDRIYNDSSRSSLGNIGGLKDYGGGGSGGVGGSLDNYNTYGLSVKFLEGLGINGPLHTKVFVANLDYKVDAKKLKQVFKLAGKVVSLDLSLDKDGHSRGFAVVEFDHPVEAVQAISMFDRQILFDRRMTVRLDRVPEKNEGPKLPEGLKGIGIGLGPNGEPLRDVARNLPNLQNNPSSSVNSLGGGGLSTNGAINTLNNTINTLNQLHNQQNSAPTPVAPPSILGPVPQNSLSGMSSNLSNNLAANLSNIVGLSGLSGVQGLSNPLLSSAAASLNTLGLSLNNANNDMNNMNQSQNQQSLNQSSFNAYNTTGFNTNRSDFDIGVQQQQQQQQQQQNQIRNYNTSSNDDYNSRNFGNTGNMSGGRKINQSDTIIVRNLPPTWTWQNLRDKFRDIGEVKFAEIRGQDTGVVRFSMEREADVAIKLLDGSRFEGRKVDVTYF